MFPPKGYYDKYPLSSENGDKILTDMFCKFLKLKGYTFSLITFPDIRPNLVSETVDAPLYAKYRKVISFQNCDGKLISLLHKYELTNYVCRCRGNLDLTLDFPDSITKINILLASES